MKTSIEQLPVELWLTIFSYIEVDDLFQAFANLNNYFDKLLTSDYLLFNVQLGQSDRNPSEYSNWSDAILNRIVSLEPNIQHETSYIPEFLRLHCSQLIQLKSLKIKLLGREIPAICLALQQLNSLDYFSVECVPNQILLEAILSAPVLRVCRVDFLSARTPINSYSNKISTIEILDIKLRDDANNSIMNLLISHMPKLKRLKINIRSANEYSIFAKRIFILPELRTIKINWSAPIFDLKFFESIYEIMPVMKAFYLNMNYYSFYKNFFDNFVNHWWPIFQQKEQINLFFKCQSLQITIDRNTQMNLAKFQSSLLDINQKYNGRIKIKWTEKCFLVNKIIEISICKFY